MKRVIALMLAMTVALSVFGGVAVADHDDHAHVQIDDQDTDGSVVEVANAMFDASANDEYADEDTDFVVVLHADDADDTVVGVSDPLEQGDHDSVWVNVDDEEAATADLTATLYLHDADADNGFNDDDAIEYDENDDGTAATKVTDMATVTTHDVAFDFNDQNTASEFVVDNVSVDADADDEYVLTVYDAAGEEVHNESVDSETDNVTFEDDELLADNDNATLTATLYTTDADGNSNMEVLGTSQDAEMTFESTTTESDDGPLGLLGGNSLPLIGDLPLVGSLSPLALGLLALVIFIAAGGGAYVYQREDTPAEVAYID